MPETIQAGTSQLVAEVIADLTIGVKDAHIGFL